MALLFPLLCSTLAGGPEWGGTLERVSGDWGLVPNASVTNSGLGWGEQRWRHMGLEGPFELSSILSSPSYPAPSPHGGEGETEV